MKHLTVIMMAAATTFFCGPALAQCGGNCSSTPPKVARQELNIVETATQAGDFKTLLTALQEAGLADTLKGSGPFTVFAPTDEAFAKLPPGTLEALLKDKNKLKSILIFHVVAGDLKAQSVLGGAELTTLQGQKLQASSAAGQVTINQAKLLKADVNCSNGVIHVIDTVLLPE